MKNKIFKSKNIVFFVIIFLFGASILLPISNGLTLNFTNADRNFSIIIQKIKQEDEIDPSSGANWQLRIYVNDLKKTLECSGNDLALGKVFTWFGSIGEEDDFVDIKMELLDKDTWPGKNDIADISAYQGGGPDDTDEFPRGAVFQRSYDLSANDWSPVDDNNDYLMPMDHPSGKWYETSGTFDGSTSHDENDVSVWFSISIDNIPPHKPEKPTGATYGEINKVYEYSTKAGDPDGDKIKYAWDWDGDNEIDEITDYYNSWETVTVSHTWNEEDYYNIKVMPIDIHGINGEWSDKLGVRITGPQSKSSFELSYWSLGHVYKIFLTPTETKEIARILKEDEDIIGNLSSYITNKAKNSGITLESSYSREIAYCIESLGATDLTNMDTGLGIFISIVMIVNDYGPKDSFVILRSQPFEDPETNAPPEKPNTPEGENNGQVGTYYLYSTSTVEPDGDQVIYLFDWSDGSYTWSTWCESGTTASARHSFFSEGAYMIKVKAIDAYCNEGPWSDPLPVTMPKNKRSFNLLNRLTELLFMFKYYKQFFNFIV